MAQAVFAQVAPSFALFFDVVEALPQRGNTHKLKQQHMAASSAAAATAAAAAAVPILAAESSMDAAAVSTEPVSVAATGAPPGRSEPTTLTQDMGRMLLDDDDIRGSTEVTDDGIPAHGHCGAAAGAAREVGLSPVGQRNPTSRQGFGNGGWNDRLQQTAGIARSRRYSVA